jgi:DNA-binding NarL/FixJ family response regulator
MTQVPPAPPAQRIIVVEHVTLVRRGLEQILSLAPGLDLAGSFSAPAELEGAQLRADAVVYGPAPRVEHRLAESVAALTGYGRVLVVHDFPGAGRLLGAIRAAAMGCVSGRADDRELVRAIETVAHGGFHVSPILAPRLQAELSAPDRAAGAALAPREREALGWLAVGLTHRQIARNMGLTEHTVSTYIKRIRTKLGVGNKADLTRVAVELGLLPPRGGRPAPVPPAADPGAAVSGAAIAGAAVAGRAKSDTAEPVLTGDLAAAPTLGALSAHGAIVLAEHRAAAA